MTSDTTTRVVATTAVVFPGQPYISAVILLDTETLVLNGGDDNDGKTARSSKRSKAEWLKPYHFKPGQSGNPKGGASEASLFRRQNRAVAQALMLDLGRTLQRALERGQHVPVKLAIDVLKFCAPHGGFLDAGATVQAENQRWNVILRLLESSKLTDDERKLIMEQLSKRSDELLAERAETNGGEDE